MSSTFHSKTLSEKTKIAEFHGRPDAWGIIMRTITANSEDLTCMTTFGNKIAAASDDGTVGIYDSVTGVLRLSLNIADRVQAVGGSPDGSTLFCAYDTPSITAWDMQTGGLIHTLVMERGAEDIAVSSKGRYLACGLSGGFVEVWEVADEMEGAAVWAGSPATLFCWLEPEERLAVSTGPLVCIWDIVARTVLRSVAVEYPVHHMIYSQKFDKLAIMASSTSGGVVTLVNPRKVIFTPKWIHQDVSCFAFSHSTGELVCGMKQAHGLQLFNISTRRWKHLKHPNTMTSVSSLQNGTVVAKFAGSGIQLLSLDGAHAPSQQQAISALTVRVFDHDRITAIFPTSRDHILLLETTTMSQLLKIPVRNTPPTPTDSTTILCASQENLTAVSYSGGVNQGILQLWRFHDRFPSWILSVEGVPEISRISPNGALLVTLHPPVDQSYVCVRNTQNGHLYGRSPHISKPRDMEFTSDTELCFHYSDSHTLYPVGSQGLDYKRSISRLNRLSELPEKRWDPGVDDAHEWVVCGSQRVCWIPPGYIGSAQPSYCWAGLSLFMAGQDGMLRKLTFRKPSFE